MKHRWHDEIVAWAGGAEIQAKSADNWFTDDDPVWNNLYYEFRIKPQPKAKKYIYFYRQAGGDVHTSTVKTNSTNYIGKIEVLDD